MNTYVRIKDESTGHHLTVTEEQFLLFGGVRLRNKAVDHLGRPLPPKYNINHKKSINKENTQL